MDNEKRMISFHTIANYLSSMTGKKALKLNVLFAIISEENTRLFVTNNQQTDKLSKGVCRCHLSR